MAGSLPVVGVSEMSLLTELEVDACSRPCGRQVWRCDAAIYPMSAIFTAFGIELRVKGAILALGLVAWLRGLSARFLPAVGQFGRSEPLLQVRPLSDAERALFASPRSAWRLRNLAREVSAVRAELAMSSDQQSAANTLDRISQLLGKVAEQIERRQDGRPAGEG